MAMCGGSIVSEHLKTSMKRYLPNAFLLNIYGITEMTGIMTMNVSNRLNSFGRILPGIEAKVKNPGNFVLEYLIFLFGNLSFR